jgi:hypothetical protein
LDGETEVQVLVASSEDESYDFRVSVSNIDYEGSKGNFSMPRPMGDDWLQRINYAPSPTPTLVRVDHKTMFVVFETLSSAKDFAEWLVRAEAEAREGYRTMRG